MIAELYTYIADELADYSILVDGHVTSGHYCGTAKLKMLSPFESYINSLVAHVYRSFM